MAAVAATVGTVADTSNGTSYVTASFTPTVEDLLVVLVNSTGSVAAAPTATASANGITFALLSTTANYGVGGIHTLYAFVANQKVGASPSAMTVTFACTADASTGVIMFVAAVSGMVAVGSAAVRQMAAENAQVSPNTPTVTFSQATLTGNPVIGCAGQVSITNCVQPAGWAENGELTISSPTAGFEYASSVAFAASTVTWGAASAGNHGSLALELNLYVTLTAAAVTGAGTTSTAVLTQGVAADAVAGVGTPNAAALTQGVVAVALAGVGSTNSPTLTVATSVPLTAPSIAGVGTTNTPIVTEQVAADAVAGVGAVSTPVLTQQIAVTALSAAGSTSTAVLTQQITADALAGVGSTNTATLTVTAGNIDLTGPPITGVGSTSTAVLTQGLTAPAQGGTGAPTTPVLTQGLTAPAQAGVGGPSVLVVTQGLAAPAVAGVGGSTGAVGSGPNLTASVAGVGVTSGDVTQVVVVRLFADPIVGAGVTSATFDLIVVHNLTAPPIEGIWHLSAELTVTNPSVWLTAEAILGLGTTSDINAATAHLRQFELDPVSPQVRFIEHPVDALPVAVPFGAQPPGGTP